MKHYFFPESSFWRFISLFTRSKFVFRYGAQYEPKYCRIFKGSIVRVYRIDFIYF